jgi:mRNA interferase YafQ
MLTPAYTRQFQRDLKRLRRGGHDLSLLKAAMQSLIAGEQQPLHCKDHKLLGAWRGRRECHLRPDWLLIYKLDPDRKLIVFERTGSHADLFG